MDSSSNQSLKPFRVLSLDGGGFRGLYTATLLRTLATRFSDGKKTDFDIGKSFDLIVGTSTGGILACGLAAGIPISDIINLYTKSGKHIFSDPQPTKPGFCKSKLAYWGLRNKRKPSSSVQGLKEALVDAFGTETILGVYNRRGIALCIPAIDADTHQPWVFKTPHNSGKTRDNLYTIVDVCLATSAAPIYFPIHECVSPTNPDGKQHFVDGGLWANNPTLIGMTEALGMIKRDQPIEIISVGTLPAPVGSVVKKTNRGLLDWGLGIEPLTLGMDAQASGYDYIAGFLAASLKTKCQIYRIDKNKACPSPDQAIYLTMDSAEKDNVQVLIKLAESAADKIHGEEMAKLSREENSLVAEIFKNLSSPN